MVTLFKHGISFRYTFIEKTNFLTSLKTKIKEIKLIKMKRKHLLFKEAVCKNRISLVKLFINQNFLLMSHKIIAIQVQIVQIQCIKSGKFAPR